MISTDFAANESWDDAWLSLKLLLQPWKWRSGKETEVVKKQLTEKLAIKQYNNIAISLFLSGRSALYYLLKSLNLPKGSKVIIQAFTCEAVVLPIIELGLKPVYIDIESETYSMNFDELSNKLTNKSKVLILQHTFGLTPKYRNEILEFAKQNKLIVIEDLAHGFSPGIFSLSNQSLITNNYYLLSFGRSKAFSSVFGGVFVSANNQVTNKLTNLHCPSYWFIFRCLLYKPLTMLIKSTYDIYFGKIFHFILNKLELIIPEITKREKNGDYDQLFNKAYPNALAILLLHQLNKFEQTQNNRAMICKYYYRSLKNNNQRLLINNWSLIRYPLLVNNRNKLIKKLNQNNLFLGKWYDQVVGPNDLDLDRVEYITGSCPNAEIICKKIINLPTNISLNEAERVVKELGLSEVEGLTDVK